MSENRNYIGIGATTGAIAGTIYGFKYPSEKTCIKLAKLQPDVVTTMKEYRDCFDILAAGQAVRKGNLTIDEYKKINDIRTAIHNVYTKEKEIIDISNTPFENRTKTFKQAVKEANQARPDLFKAIFKLNKNLKSKLIENGIFDEERFLKAMKEASQKTLTAYKELLKGALKWITIGGIAGALISAGIIKILNKN